MNLDQLQRQLFAAARTPPSDRVPYAFEKRVMAKLRELPVFDGWAQWAAALWRAAATCVILMLLLSTWAWFRPASTAVDLAQDLENTMLAVSDQEPPPGFDSLQ